MNMNLNNLPEKTCSSCLEYALNEELVLGPLANFKT